MLISKDYDISNNLTMITRQSTCNAKDSSWLHLTNNKFIVADKNDLLGLWRALEQQFNSKTMSHKIRVIRNLARAHMLEENNMKELVKHVRQLLNI